MKLFLPKTLLRFSFLTVLMLFSISSFSQTYNQVTTTVGLTDGEYLIVGDAANDGMMINTVTAATPYINFSSITNPGTTITTGYTAGNAFQVTVVAGEITIYNASVGYVSWGRAGNNTTNTADFYLGTVATTEKWTATVASGLWSLSNVANPTRLLQWNSSSPRFACYTSAQTKLKLYKKAVPTTPTVTTIVANSIATNGATLNGTVNANGFTTTNSFDYGTSVAYGSTVAATPAMLSSSTATAISATISSLALNTQYFYRAVGTVSGTPTNGSGMSFYTLAATPGVVVINNPTLTTVDVALNAATENSNPVTTQYAIQETGGLYVQANGSLGATAVWQTAAVWATKTITGLTNATTYTFQAKARNAANVETGFGATASGTTLAPLAPPVATAATTVLQNQFVANWNSVSGATSYVIDVSTSPTFQTAGGFATDLFISEYIEGSSNNKYIEIYNGTGANVNLSNYELHLFSNGTGASPSALSGFLANNSTIVLKNASASIYVGTASNNGAVAFNGNDGVALYKVSTTSYVDIFGVIGVDPGSAWTSGANTTLDKTLVRNSNVFGGVTTNPATFATLGTEWVSYPTDNIANLGSHTFNGGTIGSFVSGYENLNVGNVTTYAITGLNPGTQYYYRVRAVGATTSSNSNVISVTTNTATVIWNGTSWSNTFGPDEYTEAILTGAFDTASDGEIIAKKLTIDTTGSLIINSGTNVYVVNEVINNGSTAAAALVIENNANLVQINNTTNTGNITVHRETSALKYLDYAMWSSPVDGQLLQAFSPNTLANRFYTYNSTSNFYTAVSSPSTTNFSSGSGYLIRTPANHPTTPTIWSSTFTGFPHNGNVSLAVTNDTYNAVGNPYPSTLDADSFIIDNSISEALYFWRKENNSANPSYATYNLTGGVANTGGGSSLVPTYAIQVGQGFIAKSTSTSLNFTNSMRVADNDNLFLKSSNTVDKSRIWLDLTNTDGLFCQTLIGYMPTATSGVDSRIDGRIFSQPANGATLTSVIGNDSSYIIQGKGTFVDTDVVPLAFKTAVSGNFTIALSNVDGLFATNTQDIFLKDNLTNTITNLTNGDYTFATAIGDFLNRFEIVYQSTVLNTDNFTSNNFVVYTQTNGIVINAGSDLLSNVKVYDVRGRLLLEKANLNDSEVVINISKSNDVLLVQITNQYGNVITKKVIN